jgi:AraC family transcriptional regulator
MEKTQNGNSLVPLVRGPSLQLSTSFGLGWKSFALEHHRVLPGEKPETPIHYHAIHIAWGQQVAYGERQNQRGIFMPYAKEPGSIDLFAEGALTPVFPSTETELVVCAFDPDLVKSIAEENESSPATLQQPLGFRDASVCNLVSALEAEAKAGGPSGRLYVEHLIHALLLRLLTFRQKRKEDTNSPNLLPPLRLRRVLGRIERDMHTDLGLKVLAQESGYSTNHFLRMFRTATGYTPYQYLLHTRVKKAQAMLKNKSVRLIDIALACGFSSHAQFSRMFRQVMGVTPSEFRRGL